ncbi:nitroreductase family protein [Pectinatus frisingensis]|jgi:predicted oxidoreductase (fatty acid repression mutant protein)|uniref:nitroreductase family protein n=1 Tax=Pectinatus frisingensis TaxID=865 RepID=UPI0015F67D1D|nr:nitroreductase family protein [Pectinatus frisingensis]
MRCFQEAVSNRRTNYELGKNIDVLPSQIVAVVEKMTREVPSAFNMQSARVIVAMGDKHDTIWQDTKDALKKVVPADKFAPTEKKLAGFAAAYGTILYFDETETVKAMQKQFALYADNFPIWAQQANGMLQFAIWTALTNMGLGVNLQHYNPLIDDKIKADFSVPDSWKLIAQMPFGQPLQAPAPIEKMTIGSRVRIYA